MTIKKFLRSIRFLLLAILLTPLMLTGCLEITQNVSRKNQTISTSFSFLLQKAIFEMASDFGGDSYDFEEEFSFDDIFHYGKNKNIDLKFNVINTQLEYGYKVNISYNEKDSAAIPKEAQILLPVFNKTLFNDNYFSIDFPYDEDQGGAIDNDYAVAFLSSAKYKLLLNNNEFKVTNAVLVYNNNENEDLVTINTYGNITVIEFPLIAWLLADDVISLKVYFE